MKSLIKSFVEKFNTLSNDINIIKKYVANKEDWFVLNILSHLETYSAANSISNIKNEFRVLETRFVDLYFEKENKEYYIEFKHWVDKYKNGKPYALKSWLSKGGNFVNRDLTKLKDLNKNENIECFLVIFYTCINDTFENIYCTSRDFKDNNNLSDYFIEEGNGYYILVFQI